MKKLFKNYVPVGLLFSLWACMEIRPIRPNELAPSRIDPPGSNKPNQPCQVLPIEQNIVGTWHFESTYNQFRLYKPDTVTQGTVTFTAQRTIIDPDSLFESTLIGLPVISKVYIANKQHSSGNFTGNVFEVTSKTKKDGFQIDYFTLVSNECNRIHLRQFVSANNGVGFVLTRL